MIKINIVIDQRAKLKESTCIRLEEDEEKRKKKNAHNTINLVLKLSSNWKNIQNKDIKLNETKIAKSSTRYTDIYFQELFL